MAPRYNVMTLYMYCSTVSDSHSSIRILESSSIEDTSCPENSHSASLGFKPSSPEIPLVVEMPFRVKHTSRPPQRLEGGGFTIVDIMSGLSAESLDPFLIWHELPRAHHARGSVGAYVPT